jgi:hypothetical protein
MKTKTYVGVGVLAAACLLAGSYVSQMSAETPATPAPSALECPLLLDFSRGITGDVVDVQFIDEIQGVQGNKIKLNDEQKKKARLALVTVKITKPAGKRLTLAAADMTLHYNHGDQTEVAPCEGLSAFSTTNDGDRAMNLSQSMGPGFVKSPTAAKCIAAGTVYVDGVFAFMEGDTREVWVCLGQPVSRKPFATQGWR